MRMEYSILAIAWAAMAILLTVYISRSKIREAWTIFLFKQFITWGLGLLVVQLKLIAYPVRLFSYAHRSSFTFEFFIYPGLCVLFNLHYPMGKNIYKQGLYYFTYVTPMTLLETILEKHTLLIHYIHWHWYWTWISLWITFYISRRFYIWFYKISFSKHSIEKHQ